MLADLAAANALLANPPEVDLSVSQRLGFHVVARLAARHGIPVSLSATPGSGITAPSICSGPLFARTRSSRSARAVPAETSGSAESRTAPTADHGDVDHASTGAGRPRRSGHRAEPVRAARGTARPRRHGRSPLDHQPTARPAAAGDRGGAGLPPRPNGRPGQRPPADVQRDGGQRARARPGSPCRLDGPRTTGPSPRPGPSSAVTTRSRRPREAGAAPDGLAELGRRSRGAGALTDVEEPRASEGGRVGRAPGGVESTGGRRRRNVDRPSGPLGRWRPEADGPAPPEPAQPCRPRPRSAPPGGRHGAPARRSPAPAIRAPLSAPRAEAWSPVSGLRRRVPQTHLAPELRPRRAGRRHRAPSCPTPPRRRPRVALPGQPASAQAPSTNGGSTSDCQAGRPGLAAGRVRPRHPRRRAAVVVSADGLPLATSAGVGDALGDQLAAAASGLVSLARGTAHLLASGAVTQTILEMTEGYLFVTLDRRGRGARGARRRASATWAWWATR